MKTLLIGLTLLLSITNVVLGNNNSPKKFQQFDKTHGLSNETIVDIVQDKEGYIWVGTNDGLNRFDGNSFITYKSIEKDSTSIPGNVITCLYVDNNQNIWVGTNQGLRKYIYELDQFIAPIETHLNSYIASVIQDQKGNTWVATGKNIFIYNEEFNNTRIISGETENEIEYDASFNSLFEDSNGNIWMSTESKGIYLYNTNQASIKKVQAEIDLLNVLNMFEDQNKQLWISHSNGTALHNLSTGYFTNYIFSENSNTPFTRYATGDKSGNIWLAKGNEGVIQQITHNSQHINYNFNNRNAFSISSGAFDIIFIDKEDNIWLGGKNTGLNVAYNNARNFNGLMTQSGTEPIDNNPVSAIEMIGNTLLFGTDGDGVSTYNRATEEYSVFLEDNSHMQASILSLFKDSQGNIWSGGYGTGLNYYNNQTKELINFNQDEEAPFDIPHHDVRHITEDNEGNIWFVTNGGGLVKLNTSNWQKTHYTSEKNGLASNYCLTLKFDNKGMLWIGSYGGLSYFSPTAEKTITNFYANTDDNKALPSNWVYSIYLDTYNSLWVGTQDGLAKYNADEQNFTVYKEQLGLENSSIASIIEDNQQNIWITTNEGLAILNTKTNEIKSFTQQDGLLSDNFRMNAVSKDSEGIIWYGTTNGVVFFNPSDININTVVPQIKLSKLYVDNTPVKPGTGIADKHINYIEKLKLKHDQNFLRFDFTAISYYQANNNTFMYMLEGVDKGWVNPGDNRYAAYTNIRHGKYNFIIKAFNNDGIPSDTHKTLAIRIFPPWYKTIAFYVFSVLAFAFLIYKILHDRIEKNKRDKEQLQQRIMEGDKIINEKLALVEKQQKELNDRDEREKITRFHNKGISLFSDIIAKNRNSVEELSQKLLSNLAKYTGCCAGSIYITTKDQDLSQDVLSQLCNYCYNNTSGTTTILPGEGYVGACFLEKNTIELNDLPKGYINLDSGLGTSPINNILLVPVLLNNNCLAIFELASHEKLEAHKIDFAEKIAESYASVLALLQANEQANLSLQQNKEQAAALYESDEELRQNLEELKTIQERADERELKLNETIESLTTENEKLKEQLSHR